MLREISVPGLRPTDKIRVGEAEHQALLLLADLEKLTKAETLRLALREAAKQRGLWPPKEVVHERAA